MRVLFACLLQFCLLPGLLTGCQKSPPVDEVTAEESSVTFQQVDRAALNDDWPGWRGPSRDGHVPDQPLLTSWSDTENVAWRVDVPGRGHASPVVVDDFIVLATSDEDAETQSVLAFHTEDGRQLWKTTLHSTGLLSEGEMHRKSTNANGTVSCDGERVYVAFLNSNKVFVWALNLEDGMQVWQQEVGDLLTGFGYAPSPLLYHSFLIVAGDHRDGGHLTALDCETGEVAWRVARPAEKTFSSPAVVQLDGRDQLVLTGGTKVTSYNPQTGEELWSTDGTAAATCGTVVANDQFLFASGGYPERETICLNGDGVVQWRDRSRTYEPSLLVVDDSLFAVTDEGIAICWNAADGTENWKVRLGGNFSASPIVCNGQIYVSDLSGQTYVFNASPSSYEQVAVNQLGDDCYASPAVQDSRLYLRVGVGSEGNRQEQLVCLSAEE